MKNNKDDKVGYELLGKALDAFNASSAEKISKEEALRIFSEKFTGRFQRIVIPLNNFVFWGKTVKSKIYQLFFVIDYRSYETQMFKMDKHLGINHETAYLFYASDVSKYRNTGVIELSFKKKPPVLFPEKKEYAGWVCDL